MTTEFEIATAFPVPGGGPTSKTGPVICVPVPTSSASLVLVGASCYLMGWSFRESTGTGGAVAELIDGSAANANLLAMVNLVATSDVQAAQAALANSASGANATQTATLPATPGQTTFIQSLRITGLGATGAAQVTATLTGVLGGTISYPITVPAGVTVPITPVFDSFGSRGLPASAPNTAIVVTLPAFGAGNTLEQVAANGFVTSSAGAERTQSAPGDGIWCRGGVFLNIISGSLRGAIWIRL